MGILADITDIRRNGYIIQPSKKFQRLQGADKPALFRGGFVLVFKFVRMDETSSQWDSIANM